MVAGLLITFGYIFFVWLMFFKLKLLKFSPTWAMISFWFGLHLLLLFIIPPRFFQPSSGDARVIRHNVQLLPRLPQPTLLEEVLVEPDTIVKKGTPLFRFDKRMYEYRVEQARAQLAAAEQHVRVLEANLEAVSQQVVQARANKKFAESQVKRYGAMAKEGAGSVQELQQWQDQLAIAEADIKVGLANEKKARLEYESKIDGVNTQVAEAEANLKEQEYYLEQTTLYAPADGYITNLQAQPGMVVGIVRVGAIASFVCQDDPYLLATFFQEHLKFVEEGQPVEIALDTHPGQIFEGTVEAVWKAVGQGQMIAHGRLPSFDFPKLKGRFPVQIRLNDPSIELPAGVQGAVAIYTDHGTSFSILRRIEIRSYTWANYLYPMPF